MLVWWQLRTGWVNATAIVVLAVLPVAVAARHFF